MKMLLKFLAEPVPLPMWQAIMLMAILMCLSIYAKV